MALLSTVFEKDSIESYFSNPFVAKGDKLAALQSVAGEAGLSDVTLNLFGVMAENNRMSLVSEVAEVYARIIQADAGTVPCSVESAIPLTASQVRIYSRGSTIRDGPNFLSDYWYRTRPVSVDSWLNSKLF